MTGFHLPHRTRLACVLWMLGGPPAVQAAAPAAGTDRSASTQPAATPTGSVAGQVTTTGKRRLPDTVVYLEAVDPERRFPAPAVAVRISQKGAKFSPALLVVSVGQTVEFPNDEDRPIEHNVFSRSPAGTFDLGLYRPGQSEKVTFDKPGVVRLYCSIHRYMDGQIYVCPTPFHARVDSQGRFAIEGVPPGKYRIRTWQSRRRFREQSKPVEVVADERRTVDFKMSRK